MIVDTDKLEGFSTEVLELVSRQVIHAIIIKAYNVRVIPESIQTLDDVRELDDK